MASLALDAGRPPVARSAAEAAKRREARIALLEGQVQVNGEVELRRGRKLRAGDCVAAGGETVRILAAA